MIGSQIPGTCNCTVSPEKYLKIKDRCIAVMVEQWSTPDLKS